MKHFNAGLFCGAVAAAAAYGSRAPVWGVVVAGLVVAVAVWAVAYAVDHRH